jgi:hypothetical protein
VPKSKRKSVADVVVARQFVLVDENDRERASLVFLGDSQNELVALQLCDGEQRPQIALQVDQKGNPGVLFFSAENVPVITLTVNEQASGVCVSDASGYPCIEICVPVTDMPRINVRDHTGSTFWTSLIRLNPEKAPTEGETPRMAVLGEAGTSPAEQQSP